MTAPLLRTALTTVATLALCACGNGAETASVGAANGGSGGGEASASAEMPTSIPALADRLITDGTAVAEMLATVTDAASANAVKPRLVDMASAYEAAADKFENMDNPSFSDMTALASRAPKIAAAQTALLGEIERIRRDHPEAFDVLSESLNDIGTP